MNSEAVIRVEGLGKKYVLGQSKESGARYTTLRDALASKFKAPSRRPPADGGGAGPATGEFWALRDVNFEVRHGEVVGIIGRNGAGKSTLLKILSRITEPTSGRIAIKGRVASLLEVGTGFHPELTGRENIFLNGAILGMARTEIKAKFDEIVAFAEVERFLDTPVKRYSSGMYVRLAFAVAAHLEPEILIVDEVLAVGDIEFQKKCLGKMQSVAEKEGRTVLFVSHNIGAVQALCTKAIRMKEGRLAGIGRTDEQISSYLQEMRRDGLPKQSLKIGSLVELKTLQFQPNPVISKQPVDFQLELSAPAGTKLTDLTILVYSSRGVRVAIIDLRAALRQPGATLNFSGRIQALPLTEGEYNLGLYAGADDFHGDLLDIASIEVHAVPHEEGAPIPYGAENRGIVELDYSLERI